MRLLLVEDDKMIGESLQKSLKHTYAVNWCQDAESAKLSLEAEEYDLILLDLGLPEKSGLDLLKIIRSENNETPVIIITARDTINDKIAGLDTGADDYLIKPFDLQELEARIRVALRRKNNRGNNLIIWGRLTLDPSTHEMVVNGKSEILSKRAFALIHALLEKPKAILSRQQLEERIYGWNEEVESNAIEVHIHSLRQKFGKQIIRNVRGVGYMMGECNDE